MNDDPLYVAMVDDGLILPDPETGEQPVRRATLVGWCLLAAFVIVLAGIAAAAVLG